MVLLFSYPSYSSVPYQLTLTRFEALVSDHSSNGKNTKALSFYMISVYLFRTKHIMHETRRSVSSDGYVLFRNSLDGFHNITKV